MFRVNTSSTDAVSTGIVASIGVIPKGVVAVVLNSNLQLPKHQKDRFLHHIVAFSDKELKTANNGDVEYYYEIGQLKYFGEVYYNTKASGDLKTHTVRIYNVPNGSVDNYAKQVSPKGVLTSEVELRRRLFVNLADVQMCNTDKCYNAYKCACVNLLSFAKNAKDAKDDKNTKESLIKNYFSYVPILFAYSLIQPYNSDSYIFDITIIKNVYEFCVAGKYTHPNTNSIYRSYADGLDKYKDIQITDIKDLNVFMHKFVRYLLYVNNRNLESVSYLISLTDSPALLKKYFDIYLGNVKSDDPRDNAKVEDFKYSACTLEPFNLGTEYTATTDSEDSIIDENFLLLAGLVNKDVIVGGSSVLQSDVLSTILSQ